MMDWLQDIFFFPAVLFGGYTVWSIILGGIFLGLAGGKISDRKMRTLSLIGIVMLQLASVAVILIIGSGGFDSYVLAFLFPFWIRYPYIYMHTLLLLWIPIIAQLNYVIRKGSPNFWMASLIGLLAVVAGAILFILVGIVVGAETD